MINLTRFGWMCIVGLRALPAFLVPNAGPTPSWQRRTQMFSFYPSTLCSSFTWAIYSPCRHPLTPIIATVTDAPRVRSATDAPVGSFVGLAHNIAGALRNTIEYVEGVGDMFENYAVVVQDT